MVETKEKSQWPPAGVKWYYSDERIAITHGDCREILPQLPKVDLVLTDPPYGVTQNKQDIPVELDMLFDIAVGQVIFSQQPFTTDIINKHRASFKYDLVWDKVLTSGFLNANRMPLRRHEFILVFGDVMYHPQKTAGEKSHSKGKLQEYRNDNYGEYAFVDNTNELGEMKHPSSIVAFRKPHPSIALHRTEKPADLMEWLIKTYSIDTSLILDPFLGSGTTAYCAKKLNRRCIGIEIEERYCEIAANRCRQMVMELKI